MRKINDILDIPEEVWGKAPKITITGFEEIQSMKIFLLELVHIQEL